MLWLHVVYSTVHSREIMDSLIMAKYCRCILKVMKCMCKKKVGVIRYSTCSSVTSTSMNIGKFICLLYGFEFISLNFRVEIDFNENFESFRDCSRVKFYEIIKFTFLCRS